MLRRFLTIVAIFVVVSAGVTIVLWATGSISSPQPVAISKCVTYPTFTSTTMPDFLGMQLSHARAIAQSDKGQLSVEYSAPSGCAAGTVLSITPVDAFWPGDLSVVISSGPLRHDFGVLKVATGAPVHPECAVGVWLSANGNAYPLTCRGGEVNVGAWTFYALTRPSVMTLGQNSTAQDVFESFCGEHANSSSGDNIGGATGPERRSALSLAATYYGWNFVPGTNSPAMFNAMNAGSVAGCVADLGGPN